MLSHVNDWLNLLLRWIHILTGIAWIGSSFFFMWLDGALEAPEKASLKSDDSVTGTLWMVHSGGFYEVIKRKISFETMPTTLHWFKWEAAFTWISGITLLAVVYYMTGGMFLVDPSVSSITPHQATALGIGLLIFSWFAYDILWDSQFGRNQGGLATLICLIYISSVTYGLCHLLSGRAAYIHVGAILGTLMVGNVWVRIIPNQQRMVDAAKAGRAPDFSYGAFAKRRSVHNNYMTFPLIFIMISNHFPMMTGNLYNWLVLGGIILASGGVRHVMNVKGVQWILAPSAVILIALFFMTAPNHTDVTDAGLDGSHISFAAARAVIAQRCVACHSAHPTDMTFGGIAPNGVMFDDPARIKLLAERIKFRAVISKTMPLVNKTGMTMDERILLGKWIDQGAHIE